MIGYIICDVIHSIFVGNLRVNELFHLVHVSLHASNIVQWYLYQLKFKPRVFGVFLKFKLCTLVVLDIGIKIQRVRQLFYFS